MADLMNGEDLIGSGTGQQSTGRFTPYQWAWFYVLAALGGLIAMGFLVFKGRP